MLTAPLGRGFGRSHGVPALGAPGFLGKQAHGTSPKGLCPLGNLGLHSLPQVPVNDGRMRALHNIPLAGGTGFALLGLIGDAACFPLYQIANVHRVDQHMGDGKIFPQGAVLSSWLLIAQPLQALVLCGIGDSPVV